MGDHPFSTGELVVADTNHRTLYLMARTPLDRQAYRHLLRTELKLEIAAESDFTPIAVWTALRLRPHIVIVNADRPAPDVADAVQMITRLQPQVQVLILSDTVDPTLVEAWARCPMHGYVVKGGGVDELRHALTALAHGRPYFSAGIKPALDRAARPVDGTRRLSRRETELLPLLARGLSLRDAAARMAVSYKTADSYRTSLLRKLGVKDRVELARYAIRERIIDA